MWINSLFTVTDNGIFRHKFFKKACRSRVRIAMVSHFKQIHSAYIFCVPRLVKRFVIHIARKISPKIPKLQNYAYTADIFTVLKNMFFTLAVYKSKFELTQHYLLFLKALNNGNAS